MGALLHGLHGSRGLRRLCPRTLSRLPVAKVLYSPTVMLGREYRSQSNGLLSFRPENITTAGKVLGWALVVWVVVFWRLGYPSFWDSGDEAHYAQATREMLASGNWLVPTYEGAPFFDKPILFYVLQL